MARPFWREGEALYPGRLGCIHQRLAGVDLFFVLSGFDHLPYRGRRRQDGRIDFRDYLGAALRIVPPIMR
jgi:peptidoglycan/LPS O-acetylase OafA/YrhL